MKTNVPIELNDAERSLLADLIDRKQSKRLATRAEVVAIAQQHIAGLVGSKEDDIPPGTRIALDSTQADIYRADPEDVPLMARPDDPGYVRGWNLVKRSKKKS